MDPPEWLNKLFFEKALRNFENDDNVMISKLDFVPILKPTKNLYSIIYRAKIYYRTLKLKKSGDRILPVVIKIPAVQTEVCSEFIKEAPLFKTEMNMYSKTLIDLDQVLMASGIRPTLFPKVIYVSQDPLAIVLKDIEVDNFYDARLPPQSLDESKVIFSRLAKFHAASYFLTEQLYIDLSYYNYSVYQAEQYVKNILKSSLKLFKTSMMSWKDLDQRYVTKIDYLTENISRIGTKIFSAAKPDQGFNVLNHGDCNLGNIMVNSVDGKIEDLCLIDFQLSVFASPAVDLISCFSVMTEDNRDKYFDEIVAFYHAEFVDMLKKMGFLKPPPSLLDFHIELMRHGILQIIISICFIPHILVGHTLTEDDWKTNPNDENFKMKIYQSRDFQRIIKKQMDRMIRKGFI